MGVNKCLNNKDMAPKFLAALDKLSHDGNQETRYVCLYESRWQPRNKVCLFVCMSHDGNQETRYVCLFV